MNESARNAYCGLLNELRVRLLGMNVIISNAHLVPDWYAAESCYTQLRLMSELIALGCLVVHGDIDATKQRAFRAEYKADNIIRMLSQLHPDFYPKPVKLIQIPGGVHLEQIESGFLTKKELRDLYRECGNFLHRGNVEHVTVKAASRAAPSLARAIEWANKVKRLLEIHAIASHTNNEHLICFLAHEDAGGNACIAFAQSPDSKVK